VDVSDLQRLALFDDLVEALADVSKRFRNLLWRRLRRSARELRGGDVLTGSLEHLTLAIDPDATDRASRAPLDAYLKPAQRTP
jgi:hypothetical protein